MPDRSLNELLGPLQDDLQDLLMVYVPDKLLVPNSDRTVFTAREKNWYQQPEAVVRIDGDETALAYVIDYETGTVTFEDPIPLGTRVTCEFYFNPFSDAQLQTYLERSVRRLGVLVSATISPDAIPEPYQEAVLDLAWITVAHVRMSDTPYYHRSILGGVEVDKRSTTENFQRLISERQKLLEQLIARLRLQGLTGGQRVEWEGQI